MCLSEGYDVETDLVFGLVLKNEKLLKGTSIMRVYLGYYLVNWIDLYIN